MVAKTPEIEVDHEEWGDGSIVSYWGEGKWVKYDESDIAVLDDWR